MKRKIERAGSPLGRDQVNGFGDSFPPSKKACLDNSATNGSPLDSKLGLSNVINGKHETNDRDTTESFHRKEMKQVRVYHIFILLRSLVNQTQRDPKKTTLFRLRTMALEPLTLDSDQIKIKPTLLSLFLSFV